MVIPSKFIVSFTGKNHGAKMYTRLQQINMKKTRQQIFRIQNNSIIVHNAQKS